MQKGREEAYFRHFLAIFSRNDYMNERKTAPERFQELFITTEWHYLSLSCTKDLSSRMKVGTSVKER